MKNDELLHKWIEGSITEDELKIFQMRPEYESLVQLQKHTDELRPPAFDGDKMLSEIIKTPKAEKLPEVGKKSARRTLLFRISMAAAIMLLIGFFLWNGPANTELTHLAQKGETLNGKLPDASTFVLNAESSLSYDSKGWEKDRLLDLTGEAYFEVTKGSTFTVRTQHGYVQVLGTHFNVRTRPEGLEVSCQEGRVAVQDEEGRTLQTLTARDAIRLKDNKIIDQWQLEGSNQASWTEGIFRFKNVPLQTILKELERQFDIRIDTKNVSMTQTISCNFQIENLDLALKTSLSPLGINYKIISDQVVELYQ